MEEIQNVPTNTSSESTALQVYTQVAKFEFSGTLDQIVTLLNEALLKMQENNFVILNVFPMSQNVYLVTYSRRQ